MRRMKPFSARAKVSEISYRWIRYIMHVWCDFFQKSAFFSAIGTLEIMVTLQGKIIRIYTEVHNEKTRVGMKRDYTLRTWLDRRYYLKIRRDVLYNILDLYCELFIHNMQKLGETDNLFLEVSRYDNCIKLHLQQQLADELSDDSIDEAAGQI